MIEALTSPWPWYIAGPLLGLFPAMLLLAGNRLLGVSSTLRHMCALAGAREFRTSAADWRAGGAWNLAFAVGILCGGFLAGTVFANPEPVAISDATRASLSALGIESFSGLVPAGLFSWSSLLTWRGAAIILGGGFLIGFGAAWAGGCTSGHGLTGIADLQLPSLVALVGFFLGGFVGTYVLLPLLLA